MQRLPDLAHLHSPRQQNQTMVNLAYIGYNSENLPTSLVKGIMTLAAPYAPLDGVNEKGLAVGVLQIKTTPTNQQTDKVDITLLRYPARCIRGRCPD